MKIARLPTANVCGIGRALRDDSESIFIATAFTTAARRLSLMPGGWHEPQYWSALANGYLGRGSLPHALLEALNGLRPKLSFGCAFG